MVALSQVVALGISSIYLDPLDYCCDPPLFSEPIAKAGGFFSGTKRGDAEVSIVSKIGLTMWRPNLPAIDVAECC